MAFFYMVLNKLFRRILRDLLPASGIHIVPLIHIRHRQLFSRLRDSFYILWISVIIRIDGNGDGISLWITEGIQTS